MWKDNVSFRWFDILWSCHRKKKSSFVTPKRPLFFRLQINLNFRWRRQKPEPPGSFCWKPSVSGRHFGEVEAFGEDSPNGGRLARQQMKTTETGGFVVSDGSENQSHRSLLLICKCSALWIIFPFLITQICTARNCMAFVVFARFCERIWSQYVHQFQFSMYIYIYICAVLISIEYILAL